MPMTARAFSRGFRQIEHGNAKLYHYPFYPREVAPEVTGHGLPLSKCEAYNRVYDQPYGPS